jgi:formiminotetrahydrofolate cyclodeaminase
MEEFIMALASKEPVPGGGGASALMGALSAALCSMVANLTSGKKKYAEYQQEIEEILTNMETAIGKLQELMKKDEEAFAPLAKAYSIPKDQPDREEILEKALVKAAEVPLELAEEVSGLIPVLEALEEKGSRLAISDVAVAAAAAEGALKGAVMNVYINTKMMKNRELAEKMNRRALAMAEEGSDRCSRVYQRISNQLRG